MSAVEPKDCPTPQYHETHRYCPSCSWTEDYAEDQLAVAIDAKECYAVGVLIGVAQHTTSEGLALAYRGSHHRLRPATRRALEAAQKALDEAQKAINREAEDGRG